MICLVYLCTAGVFLQPSPVESFIQSPRKRPSLNRRTGSKQLATVEKKADIINGEDNPRSSILLRRDNLLENAFESLTEEDKYDAVLTGLCAKILDSKSSTTTEEDISGVAALLQEMNSRGVALSERSAGAAMDVAARSENASVVSRLATLCIRNRSGLVSMYGSSQNDVERRVPRQQLEVPTDERAKEVTAAIAFLTWMGGCLLLSNFAGSGPMLSDDPGFFGDATKTLASFAFSFSLLFLALDNLYDVLKNTISLFLKDRKLPDKDTLPLGIGSGQITGVIVKGLSRLFVTDQERDCQCEAAAFYTAYALGLPCFPFRPNSLEAAVLIFRSTRPSPYLPPLLSRQGLLKLLIWLMAPVAMETIKHPQLISSDPREAYGLLLRLKQKASEMDVSLDDLDSALGDDDQELVRIAFIEADRLLRENKKLVEELVDVLMSGSATVGDCVAVLEGWG